ADRLVFERRKRPEPIDRSAQRMNEGQADADNRPCLLRAIDEARNARARVFVRSEAEDEDEPVSGDRLEDRGLAGLGHHAFVRTPGAELWSSAPRRLAASGPKPQPAAPASNDGVASGPKPQPAAPASIAATHGAGAWKREARAARV